MRVKLGLNGSGSCQVATGVPFLDHMLHQISSHGLIDLEIQATGDTHIDDHHTTIIPEGFARALEVSAYSLAPLCRWAKPLFNEGASVITLSYLGAEVGAFYWTVLVPDIVNPGREEQGSVSV